MWGAGFATGVGVGLCLGIIVGSLMRQQRWSELSVRRKRTRLWLVGAGVITLAGGVAALLLAN